MNDNNSMEKDTLTRDLRFLERDLQRQLKDPKVKEFWDNTLGEIIRLKRVKTRTE